MQKHVQKVIVTILNKNSNTNTEVISTLAHEENLTQEMQL